MHNGIDLAAPGGTAVKAMRDGTVSIDRSGDVTVKHGDGSSTTYRHVNAGVEAGQKVAAGQQIATLRQHDPRSTGPHLHLEGRDANGRLIDPKSLLEAKKAEATIAEANKSSAEAMKPFESGGWKPDSWVQNNGGPWTNKRTGEVADESRAARLNEQAAKYREQARKFMGGTWRDKDGNPGFSSSGWKPQAPGAGAAAAAAPADPGFTSSGWKPTSAADAIKKVPMPEPRSAIGGQGDRAGLGAAGGSTSRGGASIVVHNNIQAGHQSPQEMAAHIQRHISEAWNYRAHDLEPELT